jgi:DNA-binding GntR family transcriptional regulator
MRGIVVRDGFPGGSVRSWEERLGKIELDSSSLSQQVSRVLTEAILEGVFSGGEKLIENKLQKVLGVSRSPIREALRDLERKGLVEIVPRKGCFVRNISARDIEEHFPVRAALEGLAAREAMRKMDSQTLALIEKTLEGMRQAVENGDAKTYWTHHRRFHELFIGACGNQLLVSLLKTLRTHALWYRFSYRYYREDLRRSLACHEEIAELFRNPSTEREEEIERKVRTHIEEAMERFLEYLRGKDGTKLGSVEGFSK